MAQTQSSRIVIRPATSRGGRAGYVADLVTPGWPVYPLVAFVSTTGQVEHAVAAYVARHPDTTVVMGSL